MKVNILLGIFVVFLGVAHSSVVKRSSEIDEGDHILICKQEPIELGIVLDSSSSIRHADFLTGIEFLQDFVDQYEINDGRQGVRVSVITFGKGIYIEDSFDLDSFHTKEDVIEAIGNIPHRAGLYTDTGKAIKYMHVNQLSPAVVRPYADKIGLVITDGNSQEWKYTRAAAAAARESGITMFAVGVGLTVREDELLNIAGDPSRVTRVDNYSKLNTILETLASKTCIKKMKPTTPPPKIQKCGELNPADVYFVFSPADLGAEATSWTTSFISQTVSTEDMNLGFRYGAISGSCPDDAGFDLDRYDTVEEIKERVKLYNANRVEKLVERVVDGSYSEDHGGRVNATNVAVLVASGGKKERDELASHVDILVNNGITVYIADPTGQGVDIDGAKTLTGRSSRQQSEALVNYLCPES